MTDADTKKQRISYVLKGNPIALARMRISSNPLHHRVFDSQKELKLISQISISNIHNDRPFFKAPIGIDCTFYFHIPKTNKTAHPGFHHVFKPDCDNCIKYLLDVCNNVIWQDDCKVSVVNCRKLYTCGEPRTEFTVFEMDNHEKDV